jgi:hypothetical protein
MVETRTADGWARATTSLLQRISAGDFDRRAIAARAAKRFSPEAIRAAYRQVLDDVLVTGSKRKKGRHR